MKRFTLMAVSIASLLFSPVIASAKEGVINSKGEWSVSPKFEEVKDTGGLYAATMGDSPGNQAWGFIDPRGNWVIKPQFEQANKFVNGIAKVMINGKVAYINEKGKVLFKTGYTEAGDFQSNGLAPALLNGKWGFINKKGAWVIKPQFAWVRSISPAGFSVVGVQ
ncbi:WG repeat-containing protein [Brevibacillus sp. NPDC003359]|uniref:WG repeat-containing protein n=1 Tax=unclassified Brevibacillus TaxID=2684853 RepID=UPI00367A7ED7